MIKYVEYTLTFSFLYLFVYLFVYLFFFFCRFLADYESMFSFHGDIEVLLQASSGVYPYKHKIVYHILNLTGRSFSLHVMDYFLTLLHSDRPKLYTILAFLSAVGL